MTTYNILVLPGDGIGPEVMEQALAVLEAVGLRGELTFNLEYASFGGAAIDSEGAPVSEATLALARKSDAVLLGAVGGPRWDDLPSAQRPERGLLRLRAALDAFCNLRPAKMFKPLASASPLHPDRAGRVDFVVVRELTGGIYFGEPRGIEGKPGERKGINTMVYSEPEILRIGKVAFELARSRAGKLVSVDKANVLEVQNLWRTVMIELSREYPDVELSHLYVDNCAMQLILDPGAFDVLVSGNLFGDILSDEAGALTGSIGMLPSASLGDGGALYEPVHGSAPDISGTGKANPLAMILSVGMLLKHTTNRLDLAGLVERAVETVLEKGLRTPDLVGGDGARNRWVTTQEMGQAVLKEIAEAETS